jgi:hypothetical protein
MSSLKKRARRKERLVNASGCFFRGPYMGETDEAVIALMQDYERVLHARSEHGRYFEDSTAIIANWEERMRQAEQNLDGDFFSKLGQALRRLQKYKDFVLRNCTSPELNELPAPDVSADLSEPVLIGVVASLAFSMSRRLARLPTEKEVRIETKRYLAGLNARRRAKKLGKNSDADLEKLFEEEQELFRKKDSLDRNFAWRRIFDRIESYNTPVN